MLWESLERPWQCCLEEAWTAYCAGSLPIGAVITDAAGHILARGRNRILERVADGHYLYGLPLAHAELNALLVLDYEHTHRPACVMYTTTEPCPLCTGAIRMAGIGEVRYASRDPVAGSVELFEATPYMRRRAIRIVGPERADLEVIIMALYIELGLVMHNGGSTWILEVWEQAVPQAVAFGKALYESGTLRRMRDIGAPAAAVINQLALDLGALNP